MSDEMTRRWADMVMEDRAKYGDNLRGRIDKLTDMLRRLEWAGPYDTCLVCVDGSQPHHTPTCELASLLKGLP